MLLTFTQAAAYLSVSLRFMADLPLPRVDVRRPGTKRAVWRYNRTDLDTWIAARTTKPGHDSPVAKAS